MSKPLTQGLAEWVVQPSFSQVPADLKPLLRTAFIDTVACLFSGEREAVTQTALTLVQNRGSRPEVPLLTGQAMLSVSDAAFVSAVSAHALDFDDMALNGHPSVVLVPALLAAGMQLGANDEKLLASYLVGYEVWAELVSREPDSLHNKGWHPTSVIGTVACAAALSHIYQLTKEQAAHALGIAASQAAGLMGNFGSMTKPLHAGWAAAHGMEAVQLAKLGATASKDVLESKTGFLAALSPSGRANRSEFAARDALRIRTNGLSIKKYPVCYAAHRVIDGVIDLKNAHNFSALDIKAIYPTLSTVTASVLHAHRPATALESKFSIEFACAMAAFEGKVGLPEVTDTQVQRSDIQQLMEKVQSRTVEPGCPIEPGFALYDAVRIELNDGSVLDSGSIRFALGHAQRPLESAATRSKWHGCLAHRQHSEEALFQKLESLGRTHTGDPFSTWLYQHYGQGE